MGSEAVTAFVIAAVLLSGCGGQTSVRAGSGGAGGSVGGGRSGSDPSGGTGNVFMFVPPVLDAAALAPACVAVALSIGDMFEGCSWPIPDAVGSTFVPNHVNLAIGWGDAGSETLFYVRSLDACGSRPNAWHYDDESFPRFVTLCPVTCNAFQSHPSPKLTMLLGCEGPVQGR